MIDYWTGCYPSAWKGIITDESFQHPAKFSSRLIERIYQHMTDQGWLREGDKVVDPFGGVALGAWPTLRYGLDWTGCELEARFVGLGNANIDRWNATYQGRLPRWGSARLLQGDSRNLASVIGEAAGVVSSPPYAETLSNGEGPGARYDFKTHSPDNAVKQTCEANYGATPGQLGAMPAGDWQAAVSSPPYEDSFDGQHDNRNREEREASAGRKLGGGQINYDRNYGNSPGQLGQDSGETFWTAARAIIEQVYQVLAPGGHAVWVVKGYVKNKTLVDFPGQWREVCEACGFTTLHEHRAMLVNHRGTSLTIEGERVEHVTESKSFFRRLAEKNGSPRIDWETVLCMVKQ